MMPPDHLATLGNNAPALFNSSAGRRNPGYVRGPQRQRPHGTVIVRQVGGAA